MFKEFFSGGSLFDLPLIAMAIFIAFFLAVLVRVLQKSRRPQYDHMASLPLGDDEGEGGRS